MNSQEELVGCLWQLMEALAPKGVRRPSIVRDGERADCEEGGLIVDHHRSDDLPLHRQLQHMHRRLVAPRSA